MGLMAVKPEGLTKTDKITQEKRKKKSYSICFGISPIQLTQGTLILSHRSGEKKK
jgi:hypothetical protein